MSSLVVSVSVERFVEGADLAHTFRGEVTFERGRYYVDGGIDLVDAAGDILDEVPAGLFGLVRDALVERACHVWSGEGDRRLALAEAAADDAYDHRRDLEEEAAEERRGDAFDRYSEGPGAWS